MKKTVLTSFTILCLLSTVFLMESSFFIQTVKASGTIHIRADGSIDPPTAPISTVDNITYTFTDNIHDSIVIERNNTVIDGAGYTLEGTGSGNGIHLSERSNVSIKNVEIRAFWEGIRLVSSSNNVISANHITKNRIGITHYGCSNNIISRNNITENERNGIIHSWSSNSIISGNQITDNNFTGIWLNTGSDNNYIFGNNITKHSDDGVWLDQSSYNSISGNNIANNGEGIYLGDTSNHNSISRNEITNSSWWGIGISDSWNNSIYHNNFINSEKQVTTDNSINIWDNGYPSGGNYWSDYSGMDSNHDGIGDTPYEIDENNQDNHPLMNHYITQFLYYELLEKYNNLLVDYENFNSTFHELLDDYGLLQGNYNSLNSTHNDLLASYDQLQSDYEATINELSNIRNLMYVFIATTVILIATTVYFVVRKKEVKP